MTEFIRKAEKVWEEFKDYVPTFDEVCEILEKEVVNIEDAAKLLNVEDKNSILLMASKAKKLTRENFGKVILLYAPLYISNYCQNGCVYCGFSCRKNYKREKLEFNEIENELRAMKEEGIDSVIILTGEDRIHSPVDYIEQACKIAANYMSEVSIEVYPLLEEEYRSLANSGVVGITIYQETYQKEDYEKLHPFGPKKDFEFRLKAVERALSAGFHEACVGPLLGLSHPKKDVLCTLLHAEYLLDRFPKAEISVSFPRVRSAGTDFVPPYSVCDKDFIKFLIIARLYLPRVGIVISTREDARLRDALIDMCITKMSAGSKTTVGGYVAQEEEKDAQFEVEDRRTVAEVVDSIIKKGLRPEFTNWVRGVGSL
ncbi:2-iminoacetate synthase ThiH [Caldicellulosiruptor acetigenus]|uniref:Biotin and thiamin synthesis associated n=1 Tax=Caldicellulosiruptor acetigenus 6A TaxID=632516 RepID=G2PVK1_9FIRM|nr:2-iminoacetate synthase ThiH [Caldicellulosiruptor acetigenus]AEM74601.1 biotin and thiamin synthesis associated [Caldicellulosiruptor acetigenus 6A]